MYLVVLLVSISGLLAQEHPGAYSSPQYAKLLYPRQPFKHYVTKEMNSGDFERMNWVKHNKEIIRRNGQSTNTEQRSTFFDSASSFMSGAGGQMMAEMAQNFIGRANGDTTTQVGFECIAQVLSLNLTNLVILVVLKALILTAGYFGAGTWKGHHPYARSIDGGNLNAELMTEDELQLLLGYIASSKNKNYGCLEQISCRKPDQAKIYASAAELLYKTAGTLMGNKGDLVSYGDIIDRIRNAAKEGERTSDSEYCQKYYECHDYNSV